MLHDGLNLGVLGGHRTEVSCENLLFSIFEGIAFLHDGKDIIIAELRANDGDIFSIEFKD